MPNGAQRYFNDLEEHGLRGVWCVFHEMVCAQLSIRKEGTALVDRFKLTPGFALDLNRTDPVDNKSFVFQSPASALERLV